MSAGSATAWKRANRERHLAARNRHNSVLRFQRINQHKWFLAALRQCHLDVVY
jgi:hypothetical protein